MSAAQEESPGRRARTASLLEHHRNCVTSLQKRAGWHRQLSAACRNAARLPLGKSPVSARVGSPRQVRENETEHAKLLRWGRALAQVFAPQESPKLCPLVPYALLV